MLNISNLTDYKKDLIIFFNPHKANIGVRKHAKLIVITIFAFLLNK